jgi:hypothetical protein
MKKIVINIEVDFEVLEESLININKILEKVQSDSNSDFNIEINVETY